MFKPFNRRQVLLGLTVMGAIAVSSIIPLRIAIARQQAPVPQAILVLEGQPERVRFAATFARVTPALPIWISGNPRGQARNQAIFRQAGVPDVLVHYDFCATDTVTNFTCNVSTLTARKIQHVYVITSDYHMTRSLAIATLVFGSQGIAVTPVPVDSTGRRPEAVWRTVRDCVRSLVWMVTGRTGASLRQLDDHLFSSHSEWVREAGGDL